MNPEVEAFFDETTNTISYVVWDPNSSHCAVIDPVLDLDAKSGHTHTESAAKIVEFIQSRALKTDWILETHVHADHVTASAYLKVVLGGGIAIGNHISDVQSIFKSVFNAGPDFATDGSQFDQTFEDGQTFAIGTLEARALHTPGHTPACLTYVIGDAAFVGDTLFMPDYGTARCDFPGGNAATLYQSIQKIYRLPPSTRLFMCHDYKAPNRNHYAWETSVAEQKAKNIHVNEKTTQEEFVAMRTKRDAGLAVPELILPSVQINMRAGQFPPPETNGVSYLKIPLNSL